MNKSESQNGCLPTVFTDKKFIFTTKKLMAFLELSLLQISKAWWTCIQTSVFAGFDTVYDTL